MEAPEPPTRLSPLNSAAAEKLATPLTPNLAAPVPASPAQPASQRPEPSAPESVGSDRLAAERQRLARVLQELVAQELARQAADNLQQASRAGNRPKNLTAERHHLADLLDQAVGRERSEQQQVRVRRNLAARLSRGSGPSPQLQAQGQTQDAPEPAVNLALAPTSGAITGLSPRVMQAIQSVVGQRFSRLGCVDLVQEVRRRMGLPALAFQGQAPTRYVPHLAHLLAQQGARVIRNTEAQPGDIIIANGHTGVLLNANMVVHNSTRGGYRGAVISMAQWQNIWPSSRIFRPVDVAVLVSSS